MNKCLQIKALLILLGKTGQIVFGQEDFGNENARGEYLNVFKNVPTLFEYLLDTLEENPEILEKNNVEFKAADDDVSDDVTRFQRSVNHDEKRGKNIYKGITSKKEEDIVNTEKNGKELNKVTKTRYYKRNANEKTVSKRSLNDHEEQNQKDVDANDDQNKKNDNVASNGKNKENTNYIKVLKRNTDKSHVPGNQSLDNENEEQGETEEKKEEDGEDFHCLDDDQDGGDGDADAEENDSFDGESFQYLTDETLFRLTSEEIAAQALKVEEMLEQHNSSR